MNCCCFLFYILFLIIIFVYVCFKPTFFLLHFSLCCLFFFSASSSAVLLGDVEMKCPNLTVGVLNNSYQKLESVYKKSRSRARRSLNTEGYIIYARLVSEWLVKLNIIVKFCKFNFSFVLIYFRFFLKRNIILNIFSNYVTVFEN